MSTSAMPGRTRAQPSHYLRDPCRQPRDGRTPAAQEPAQADPDRLRLRAARDVRAALPLRLRRRHQHGRRRLRRLPDSGDHRPDGDLRRPADGRRTQRGHQGRRRGPLPLAPHRPLGGADRAHRRRPRHELPDPERDAARRRRRGVPAERAGLRPRSRVRPRARLLLRLLVDQRLHRPVRARSRDRPVGRVHMGLPAHVRLRGVRPDLVDAGASCARSRGSTP